MKVFWIGVVFMILASNVYGTLPVIDYTAISRLYQQYQQLKRQYDLLSQTYRNAEQQLDQFKRMVSDSEGHYGFGNWQNSALDLQHRQWSPDTWNNALEGLSGGNPERYEELVQIYQDKTPHLSFEDYSKGSDPAKFDQYAQKIAVNRAATVQATYAFEGLNQHFEQIHALSNQIETAENTKAIMDLNARLLAELAYISIETLKMETLINQQLAQRTSHEIAAETREAQFNRFPG